MVIQAIQRAETVCESYHGVQVYPVTGSMSATLSKMTGKFLVSVSKDVQAEVAQKEVELALKSGLVQVEGRFYRCYVMKFA